MLKKSDDCSICGNPFLEGMRHLNVLCVVLSQADQYPLVVRLPCNDKHLFDLECIQPWLKLNSTCPLDRKVLAQKRPPPQPEKGDEEDYDDMYG